MSTYRLHCRTLPVSLDAEDVFAVLFAHAPYAFWLDSSRVTPGYSRYSYMGDASGPLAEMVLYTLKEKRIDILNAGKKTSQQGDIFSFLKVSLAQRKIEPALLPLPFQLGYVGYFGYELKSLCDGNAAHMSTMPDAAFMFCDRALAFDHQSGKIHLLCLTRSGEDQQAEKWFEATQNRLAICPTAPLPATARFIFTPRHNDVEYLERIMRCQEHIRAGDAYEICLTNNFTASANINAFAAYRALRRSNPAPYSAYLHLGDMQILCSSPERFLSIDAQGNVESKPIKGTARRGATHAEDEALKAQLGKSEKDRAENLMIVDLLRNDLSRTCETGSVHVPKLFEVESYATLHQLVSTIRGKLRSNKTAIDCIRAAFPGGSMTGAPKLRAMQIIDELEGAARGVYSGALGWLSLDGAADFNIVIRTLVATPGRLTVGAGGAITALSDPASELAEMHLKALATTSLFK